MPNALFLDHYAIKYQFTGLQGNFIFDFWMKYNDLNNLYI